jgi:hypothetical protein
VSFDLFHLVPAVYRLRDAQIAASMTLLTPLEQAALTGLQAALPPLSADQQAQLDQLTAKSTRGPLESLLMVIEEQLAAFAEDLDQLYDDQFIETCAPWVIPYIGDLIGYQSIQGIAPAVDNSRSEVAETISMRRRKGTVLVLEQLARDVTGWGAHAAEFFRVLGDTQYMKHVRRENHYSPDVRGWRPRLYRNSGFSKMTRTVDVRNPAAPGLPRFNVGNIGIFLWSIGAYSITDANATEAPATAGAFCYRFDSLGMDIPLFHRAVSQGEQISDPATPVNVPDRLHRLVLCADMQNGIGSAYYGQGSSLAIYLGGQLLNPYQIQVADLSGADGAWNNVPFAKSTYSALIDPELGRLALPPVKPGIEPPTVKLSYFYGFNANIGGGEYEREDTFIVNDQAKIFPLPDTASPKRYHHLQEALTFVVNQLALDGEAALEITNSDTHAIDSGGLKIDLPAGTTVELRAAQGNRPTLLLDGEFAVTGEASSTFIINGLRIGASQKMIPGSPSPAALVHVPTMRPDGSTNLLGELDLKHSALVPGWSVDSSGNPVHPAAPALIAEPAGVQISAERSILGAIAAAELVSVSLCDSILDATDRAQPAYAAITGPLGGGALSLTGCTVVGTVHASVLTLVSNSIIWAAPAGLVADRKQTGCVRFSFLPYGSLTPRRFECVEQAVAAPQPIFISFRYGGRPGYLKMLACTDDTIRRGADDGGEMGAFHFVLAPQRETDLNVRLQEYLPVGLSAGLIYQS